MTERAKILAVIGGGPAGLMAAECARAGGAEVHLYDAMASVGRKILIAGKGGLNLSHGESPELFLTRFRERREHLEPWLRAFGAVELQAWARDLGIETMVGSSGRIFPRDLKAAPLLRSWVRRLREQGVHFHTQFRWLGWGPDGELQFAVGGETQQIHAQACILALGGGSWPRLGANGHWVPILRAVGVDVAELRPANCGFECSWSPLFKQRFAGMPLKTVTITFDGQAARRGELMLTEHGLEGSLIYAVSAELRERLDAHGTLQIDLDLMPDRTLESTAQLLSRPRGRRSASEFLRRVLGLDGVRLGLLHEVSGRSLPIEPMQLARLMKALPLRLHGIRPIAEAISSAGGVRFEALDPQLMLQARPGVFCAGEMLDWEAPTGGYLLTACMASGRHAAAGALAWMRAAGTLARSVG